MEPTSQTTTDDTSAKTTTYVQQKKNNLLDLGHQSPIQVCVSTTSCTENSPSSSPQISPKLQLKFRGENRNKEQLSPNGSSVKDGSTDLSFQGNEDSISRSSESGKSVEFQKSVDSGSCKDFNLRDKKGGDKKKKTSSWYNVLNPSYKSRSDDFKRLFKELPDNERLLVDYSCALQKDILVQGRLYISQNYVCFYANIFRWETVLVIRCIDVTAMTKEKTARVIPNAIQICTELDKHFFTSFGARDKTYLMLFRVWQNALMEQPMSIQELWQCVHYNYGDELGLTSDDDDYIAPPTEDDVKANGMFLMLPEVKDCANKTLKTPTELCIESISMKTSSCKESPSPSTPAENQNIVTGSERENEASDLGDVVDSLPTSSSLPKIVSRNDVTLPTDLSDSTDSDNDLHRGESKCICETHVGKEFFNFIYPVPLDQVFNMLFTESKFYSEFLKTRKTMDLVQSPWLEANGVKTRQITYTLTLGLAMGPKTAQTSEKQTILRETKPGFVYIIEVEAVTMGVPYSDTFYTHHRYCLTYVSPNECRIRVHSQIKYKKSVWGLVKNFIEKNCMAGIEDYMKDLKAAFDQEISKTQQKPLKIRRRRRLHKPDALKSESVIDGTGKNINSTVPGRGALEIGRLVNSPDGLVKIVLFILVVLLCLNALLYYKLWSLETQANKLFLPSTYLDFDFIKNSPLSSEEWAELVQQQEQLHQVEMQKWMEILENSIQLLQQTEDALTTLQKGIRPYQLQRLLHLFGDKVKPVEES
uniref:VASt domain-containing protein n=1 Tax=Strigamia maritima TaxID=126957 RepID=T1J6N1_STRMM